jgi:hypothetical protein
VSGKSDRSVNDKGDRVDKGTGVVKMIGEVKVKMVAMVAGC